MAKEIIISGIQPTGKLHIGNYLGSLRNFVELQKQHTCYFFIADLHSLTEEYDPKNKRAQITELVKDFVAAGLDPKQSAIFIQSDVVQHTELAWILSTVTPMSYLQRMTQYKDKASRQQQNINLGLFSYPVLQAADILMYKATAVPVGKDQDQHVELTRQIAKFFNNKFGNVFPEPKTLHTETPKIMSLLDPIKKMSKSLGDNHCIYLDDESAVIEKKLSKAVTDTGDGKGQGAQNLVGLTKIFSAPAVHKKFSEEMKRGTIKYAELKKQLSADVAAYFTDFRKNKKNISDQEVEKIVGQGAQQAKRTAMQTMAQVHKKIGLQ